jgi:hypothetical protein
MRVIIMLTTKTLVSKLVRSYATDGKAVFTRAQLIADNLGSETTEADLAALVTIGRVVADFPELAGPDGQPTSTAGWDAAHQALLTEPAYKVSKSTIGSLGRAYRLPAEIGGVTDSDTVAMAYKVITRSGTANALKALRFESEQGGITRDKTDTMLTLTGVLKGWRDAVAEAKPIRDTAADDVADVTTQRDLPAIDTADVPESVEVTIRTLQAIAERPWSLADITALYGAIDELIPALQAQADKLTPVTA